MTSALVEAEGCRRLPRCWQKRVAISLAAIFLVVSAFFLGVVWAQPPRPGHWAKPVSVSGSKNMYQVAPGLYRSAQPQSEAFKEFEKMGIKTVIALNPEHPPGDRKLAEGTNLRIVIIPMRSANIQPEKIVAVLREIKNSPGPVLVHCTHGADRTGLVFSVYRVVCEGWNREVAIDEMVNGGYRFKPKYTHMPEYIRTFDAKSMRAALGLET